ncbi:tyrosine-type recombinase/integrase [Elusimicrobiota bacterium]
MESRKRFFSRTEIDSLLMGAPPQLRVAILLGVEAGGRAGEISQLRWEDVDVEGVRIYWGFSDLRRGQGQYFRPVLMGVSLRQALIQWRDIAPGSEFVVPWRKRERLSLMFRRRVRECGIEEGCFYMLRSTFFYWISRWDHDF